MTRNVLTQDVSCDIVHIVRRTQHLERRREAAMDAIIIGKKLIELRGSRTQEEVAKAVDISPAAIGMYERGERIPRDEVKIRLAEYYAKSVQDIFFT